MVNKEMKFLDNGDIRYEIVDETARSNIQTINTVLDTKADTSNVTALDTRVTGVEDDCYNSYAVGTASGTVASFSDGADDLPIKSLIIDINPVQDLHGYDSPWPAGGGVNKFDEQIETGLYNTTGKSPVDSYWRCKNLIPVVPGQTYQVVKPNVTFYWYGYADTSYTGGTSLTASGELLTIPDGINFVAFAMKKSDYGDSYQNNIAINYPSTVATYSPYENICPISGWTGVNVVASGKNVFGGNALKESVLANIPNSTSGTDANGDYVSFMAQDAYNKELFTAFKPNTQYTLIIRLAKNNTYTSTNIQVMYTDNTYAYLTRTGTSPNTPETVVFTTPVGKSIKYIGGGYQSAGTYLYYDQCGVFEGVLTADDFEPYSGQTIPISWQTEAGTVYGGKLDVITGELTVDKAMVDLETLNWTTASTRCRYELSDASAPPATSILPTNVMFSDMTLVKASTSLATYGQIAYLVSSGIQTLIAYYNGILPTGQLVYELAEPITIQLTPHEIKSLLGANNIFANTGDVDVEYKADTTLYIERLIESNVDRAEEAKIDAQNSATQAEQSASQALTYKTDTESARDEAQSIVDSISANASQIDTNTENITSLEEDKYKPYVTDSTSGAIASFTDGADDLPLKSLVVNIDPVQDLHGYDSPWVAGGGKNLIDSRLSAVQAVNTGGTWNNNVYTLNGLTFTVADDGHITINGTATANTYFTVYRNSEGITLPAGSYVLHKSGNADIIVAAPKDGAYWTSATTNDSVVSLTESARISYYVQIQNEKTISNYNLYPMFESGTTATQWTPYENICPISGWKGMTVNKTGVNLFGGLPLAQSIYDVAYETTAKIDTENHTVEFTRGAQHEDGSYRGIIFDKFKPDKQYTFIFSASQNTAGTNNSIRIVYSDGSTYAVTIKSTDKMIYTTYRYTTPVGKSVAYIALDYFGSTLTTLYCDKCGIFEGVVSVDDFKPYNGITIPIDWQSEAGTVYGGKLDVLTGVLTVDRAIQTVTASDSFTMKTAANFRYFETSGSGVNTNEWESNVISNFLKANKGGATGCRVQYNKSMNPRIIVDLDNNVFTSVEELKSYLQTTPLTIIYPLATPLTIQLTPNEVKSLLGQNNIFADTGDTTAEYRADTKLYIERLTAPDSADMIADSNIVSGQYFMVSNALYKATTNIANGGQIIVGTNCTKVSLATALNEINA